MSVTIRPVKSEDRAEWDALYHGYAIFYQVEQTAEMRDRVWSWLFDASEQFQGLVAVGPDGVLTGLAHFRPFALPLTASVGGYLDDLFVSPAARGAGLADALIEGVKAEGMKRGWSVITWITAEDNSRARGVYDRMATRTSWVTYEINL